MPLASMPEPMTCAGHAPAGALRAVPDPEPDITVLSAIIQKLVHLDAGLFEVNQHIDQIIGGDGGNRPTITPDGDASNALEVLRHIDVMMGKICEDMTNTCDRARNAANSLQLT